MPAAASGRAGRRSYFAEGRSDEATRHQRGKSAARTRLLVEEFVTSVLVRLYERRRLQHGLKTMRPWDIGVLPPGDWGGPAFRTEGELAERITDALAGLGLGVPDALSLRGDAVLPGQQSSASILADGSVFLRLRQWSERAVRTEAAAPRSGRSTDSILLRLELLVLHAGDPSAEHSLPLARIRMRHIERCLVRWTMGAMLDEFHEWAANRSAEWPGVNDSAAMWARLWLRYLPAIDWSGLEEFVGTSWQLYVDATLTATDWLSQVSREVVLLEEWRTGARMSPVGPDDAAQAAERPATVPADTTMHDVARWMEDTIESIESAFL